MCRVGSVDSSCDQRGSGQTGLSMCACLALERWLKVCVLMELWGLRPIVGTRIMAGRVSCSVVR